MIVLCQGPALSSVPSFTQIPPFETQALGTLGSSSSTCSACRQDTSPPGSQFSRSVKWACIVRHTEKTSPSGTRTLGVPLTKALFFSEGQRHVLCSRRHGLGTVHLEEGPCVQLPRIFPAILPAVHYIPIWAPLAVCWCGKSAPRPHLHTDCLSVLWPRRDAVDDRCPVTVGSLPLSRLEDQVEEPKTSGPTGQARLE